MMTNKKRKAVKELAAFFVQKWKGATENDKKNKINASGITAPQGADA